MASHSGNYYIQPLFFEMFKMLASEVKEEIINFVYFHILPKDVKPNMCKKYFTLSAILYACEIWSLNLVVTSGTTLFNIQKFYLMLTDFSSIIWRSQKEYRLLPSACWFHTEKGCVYCALRAISLNRI